jgi:hypothetical protein
MQSLSRKLRRNNAFMTFNATTKQVEIVERKGTKNYANRMKKERFETLEDNFLKEVTKPLTRMQVRKSTQRQVFC